MRLDTHIHTEYSLDGVNKPKEILEYVKRFTSLDAIAFTDHNILFSRKVAEELTREYGILVIPGIELGKIGSGRHIVALNIDDSDVNLLRRYKNPYEIVEYISAQGGLSIAAHPVPNGYTDFYEMGFDAVETINGGCARNNLNIENPCHLPEIGCSDAHLKYHTGRAWTEIEDVYIDKFNEKTTACNIRRITEDVIEKIKKGLCKARGNPTSDAHYLNYGFFIGKKYINKSFKALCSLVI